MYTACQLAQATRARVHSLGGAIVQLLQCNRELVHDILALALAGTSAAATTTTTHEHVENVIHATTTATATHAFLHCLLAKLSATLAWAGATKIVCDTTGYDSLHELTTTLAMI